MSQTLPSAGAAGPVSTDRSGGAAGRRIGTKVPQITAWFWVVKILTTGMGETASDFLTHRLDPVVAVGVGGVGLVAALGLQFRVRRYIAAVYWLAAAMVSVFGTMAADAVHVTLGVPYLVSTLLSLAVLIGLFAVWYRVEGTLSVHSIHTTRRELFYWATVLTTFALGTAAGDLSAHSWGLGYLTSGVVFAVAIVVPAVAHRWWGLDGVVAFWLAYVLTRPLGASFADWSAVPADRGGLDLGTGPVTLVLAAAIVLIVGYLTATRADAPAR